MKNIFILLFLWLLVGCQNMQNPPNISQNTEGVARVETQNTESSKTVSQNNEVTAQVETQKEEKTEDDSSQNIDDCVFSGNNFCFSDWENREKIDLGNAISLQLSKSHVDLYLEDRLIESQNFNDYLPLSAMTTMWYWDFLDEVCADNPWCDFDEAAKQYPETLKKIVQKSLKEKVFYRVNSERMIELTNLPKDIAIVGSWFYEYYGDLYVFDVKNKQFLTMARTDRLNYVYKNEDFVVIQEGEWGFGDENTELTFFFKNGSTAKIHDPSEGKITLKSVKIDENKNIDFIYQCSKDNAENVEKCDKQEKEVIFNKKLEELFWLSEK